MNTMRHMGAAIARARTLATILLVALASGPAIAAVREAGSGVSIDRTMAPQRRGAETLHAVRVDRRHFEANGNPGRALDLPGTGTATLRARFDRSQTQGENWTWVGKVDTDLGEQAVVVTFGPDAVFGTIPQRRGPPLRIESRAGRTWLVEGEAQSLMRDGGKDDARIAPMPGKSHHLATIAPTPVRPANTAPVVDVIVAYTPSMITHYGSESALRTRLLFLEQLTNQAFHDTPADVRIRVLAHLPLDYTTASANSTALDLITHPANNAIKSQVDAWRAQYQADLVVLIRAFDATTQPDCGQGWIGDYHGAGFDAAYGFSVVGDGTSGGKSCPDQTFAHELGHNFGAHHDIATADGDYGARNYSRGHRMTLGPGSGFATIMAYTQAPQTRLNRFSNPRLPHCVANLCGVSGESDNAKTLSDAGWSVASYRGDLVAPSAPIALVVGPAATTEGNSGTKQMSFRATLSDTSSNPVTFEIRTSDLDATAGSDYVAIPPTMLSIPAGASHRDFTVTLLGDTVAEDHEQFRVLLSNVSGAIAGPDALGTITNDDKPLLSIADVAISEGNSGTTSMTFTVRLSAAAPSTVAYSIATHTTSTTTAEAALDFIPNAAIQTISAGATTKTFTVDIVGDTIAEANEVFVVKVENVIGAIVADGAAQAMIRNDDRPKLSLSNASVVEGNEGTRSAVFVLALSQPATAPVTLGMTTLLPPGTTASASDFHAASQASVTIPAGQVAKTFSVAIVGDTAPELNETFVLVIESMATTATSPVIVDGAGRGTIVNDDIPKMTIGDVVVDEGDSGNPIASFTVQLSGPAAGPVVFDIATLSTAFTTAAAGSDYIAKSQVGRTIPVGGTSAMFNVGLVGDTVVEGNEVFVVTLANVSGAWLGDGAARATIVDDD